MVLIHPLRMLSFLIISSINAHVSVLLYSLSVTLHVYIIIDNNSPLTFGIQEDT